MRFFILGVWHSEHILSSPYRRGIAWQFFGHGVFRSERCPVDSNAARARFPENCVETEVRRIARMGLGVPSVAPTGARNWRPDVQDSRTNVSEPMCAQSCIWVGHPNRSMADCPRSTQGCTLATKRSTSISINRMSVNRRTWFHISHEPTVAGRRRDIATRTGTPIFPSEFQYGNVLPTS